MSDNKSTTVPTNTEEEIIDNTNDYNYGANYDPEKVDEQETINVVMVIDISPSVEDYVAELNASYNGFVKKMQSSPSASKILLSLVLFNDKIHVEHGFKPISEVKEIDITNRLDGTTHLYSATKTALDSALTYRNDLEGVGINCKTLLFIITDGDDNERGSDPGAVKTIIKDLKKEERNAFSFESILFGVGDSGKFEAAKDAMGINKCATVKNTPDEIRKMIAFISSSVVSASTGAAMPDVDVNF